MNSNHDEGFEIDPAFIEQYIIFIGGLTNIGQKCCDIIQKKGAANKERAMRTLHKVVEEIEKASQGLKTCMPPQIQEVTPSKKH